MPVPNLIDKAPIDAYLEQFLPSDPESASLLKLALAKVLAKRAENMQEVKELPPVAPDWLRAKWPQGGPYHHFVPDSGLGDKVRHVADWIAASKLDNDPWLTHVDGQGRPHKLLKLGSLDQAYGEADKAMRLRNQRMAKQLVPAVEGEEIVMAMPDGFSVVRLLTSQALDREGIVMGHCIGQGGYDEGLENGSRQFFSLRDAKNQPHATLEVDVPNHTVLQCQGKENKAPVARYLPYLQAYLRHERYHLNAPANRTGLVEANGEYYSIHELPRNLTVNGDLDLEEAPIAQLPDGLRVQGTLNLRGTPIRVLPEGLEVGEYLSVSHTQVTHLPERLLVGGSINLSNSAISTLPPALRVGGSLYLDDTSIASLPAQLEVGGQLNVRRTPITTLPDDLKVGGTLLVGSRVAELPSGLSVGGDLDLSDAHFIVLPAGLKVGRDLRLERTSISALPPGLEVGGSLLLRRMPIGILPEGLKVGGDLDLGGTPIAVLPKLLEVGGTLDLSSTAISTLPDDLKVGRTLNLSGTPIVKLPEGLEVGGNLYLNGTRVSRLPERLKVGGNLQLAGTAISEVGSGLKVGGDLDLRGAKVKSLPEGLMVGGDLDLRETPIVDLPNRLSVGGNLSLAGTRVTALPPGLSVGGDLHLHGTGIAQIPDDVVVSGVILSEIPIKRVPRMPTIQGAAKTTNLDASHAARKPDQVAPIRPASSSDTPAHGSGTAAEDVHLNGGTHHSATQGAGVASRVGAIAQQIDSGNVVGAVAGVADGINDAGTGAARRMGYNPSRVMKINTFGAAAGETATSAYYGVMATQDASEREYKDTLARTGDKEAANRAAAYAAVERGGIEGAKGALNVGLTVSPAAPAKVILGGATDVAVERVAEKIKDRGLLDPLKMIMGTLPFDLGRFASSTLAAASSALSPSSFFTPSSFGEIRRDAKASWEAAKAMPASNLVRVPASAAAGAMEVYDRANAGPAFATRALATELSDKKPSLGDYHYLEAFLDKRARAALSDPEGYRLRDGATLSLTREDVNDPAEQRAAITRNADTLRTVRQDLLERDLASAEAGEPTPFEAELKNSLVLARLGRVRNAGQASWWERHAYSFLGGKSEMQLIRQEERDAALQGAALIGQSTLKELEAFRAAHCRYEGRSELDQLLFELLAQKDGVFLGEAHAAPSLRQALNRMLPQLQARGVGTLALEIPQREVDVLHAASSVEEAVSRPPFRDWLKTAPPVAVPKIKTVIESEFRLVQHAKDLGIRVLGYEQPEPSDRLAGLEARMGDKGVPGEEREALTQQHRSILAWMSSPKGMHQRDEWATRYIQRERIGKVIVLGVDGHSGDRETHAGPDTPHTCQGLDRKLGYPSVDYDNVTVGSPLAGTTRKMDGRSSDYKVFLPSDLGELRSPKGPATPQGRDAGMPKHAQ